MRLLGDPIFIDIEASSLDSGSFPIEIAWVDSSGHGETYLICPSSAWRGWSAASEKLHGINRAMLESDGLPASAVAKLAYDALHGKAIHSDNPAFDAYWLGMLMELIGQPSLSVKDFETLRSEELYRLRSITADDRLLEEGRRFLVTVDAMEKHRPRTIHRAQPDADSLWRRWHAIKLWGVDQQLNPSRPATS